MPVLINDIMNNFANDMKKIFGEHYRETIVYGSYARGDYDENSDIDVMILVDFSEEDICMYKDKVSDCAFDYFISYGVDISPIIKNEEHFNKWVEDLPYYYNVRQEGVSMDVRKYKSCTCT